MARGQTKEQLRKLRQRYRLGEYSKKKGRFKTKKPKIANVARRKKRKKKPTKDQFYKQIDKWTMSQYGFKYP